MSGRPCGKVRYDSAEQAERALTRTREIMRRTRAPKRVTRAYRCPKCRGWHLTSRDHA